MEINKKFIEKFIEQLEIKCDFKQSNPKDKKSITWNCGNNHSFSKQILSSMGLNNEETKSFLSKCEEYGGYCDCEILFNSEERLLAHYGGK